MQWIGRAQEVDQARKDRAAVKVTNGSGDAPAPTRVPQDSNEQMLRDVASLVNG